MNVFKNNDVKEIKFYEGIDIEFINGDEAIYNVLLSKRCLERETEERQIFFLQSENMPLIKKIDIYDSKLFITYIDGRIVLYPYDINSITISDTNLQKRFLFSLAGTLLRYDKNAANRYNLDKEKVSIFETNEEIKKRMRTM